MIKKLLLIITMFLAFASFISNANATDYTISLEVVTEDGEEKIKKIVNDGPPSYHKNDGTESIAYMTLNDNYEFKIKGTNTIRLHQFVLSKTDNEGNFKITGSGTIETRAGVGCYEKCNLEIDGVTIKMNPTIGLANLLYGGNR